LTFGLGIIILQGVSRRKYLAGVNIMGSVILLVSHRLVSATDHQSASKFSSANFLCGLLTTKK
jgi:hypothetical protein